MNRALWIEWLVILVVGYLYASSTLLTRDSRQLQQTGEHSPASTLPILAEIGLHRYGEIPLWDPYMVTGFPYSGDFLNHFWNPVSTIPILLWGGIVGMRVSVFLSFVLAGLGQWFFAHVFGLRGPVRLWAALLFMVSGGLAFLWRLGWYEMLLGAAWLPWCFGSLWWTIHRRNRISIVLAAFPLVLVIASGAGYYPFYLTGCSLVLVTMAIVFAPREKRWARLWRGAAVGLLAAALAAVVIVPWVDSVRYTVRESGPAVGQAGSQPIVYALINYLISDPVWFGATNLGMNSGYHWFYIGWLPLAALVLVPLALQSRRNRSGIVTLVVLVAFLLAWHANRHTFFKFIYDHLIHFLYNLRFPERLLVVATSPLIVLAGLGLQHLWEAADCWGGPARSRSPSASKRKPLRWLAAAPILLLLFLSIRSAYSVNKAFGFSPGLLDPQSFETLGFLRRYDRGAFYTAIGGSAPFVEWTAAAYFLEMPVINFSYNRRLASQDTQGRSGSPFFAKAKYILTWSREQPPRGTERIRELEGWTLWRDPEALPFAFSVPLRQLQSGAAVAKSDVRELPARIAGPNRVVIRGTSGGNEMLVTLVSDYPGWTTLIDGNTASKRPVNGYLGTEMRPGWHDYTFVFRPFLHRLGLLLSVAALLLCAGLIVTDIVGLKRETVNGWTRK